MIFIYLTIPNIFKYPNVTDNITVIPEDKRQNDLIVALDTGKNVISGPSEQSRSG